MQTWRRHAVDAEDSGAEHAMRQDMRHLWHADEIGVQRLPNALLHWLRTGTEGMQAVYHPRWTSDVPYMSLRKFISSDTADILFLLNDKSAAVQRGTHSNYCNSFVE